MGKWKRRILFWSLVTLFLLTAPVVILSARGYRFDLSRGVFVHSGTITFKPNPQTVNVTLNGEEVQSKANLINNSYNIGGLIPRNYNIRVFADGFQTWDKTVDVHSGLATEFWNVLLVRENYDRTNEGAANVEKIFISSDGALLAYPTPTENGLAVKIVDTDTKNEEYNFDIPDWKFIGQEKKENIEWSTDMKFLSVPVQKNENSITTYNYVIADLENKTTFNLNEFLDKKNISNVRWDPRDKDYVIFLSENSLYRANIKENTDTSLIVSDVSAFDLAGNDIYYTSLGSNLIFRKISADSDTSIQITSDFPGPENISIKKITVYDNARIALILENNDLYIFNKGEHENYFKKLDDNVNESSFSDDGKKMLFWSDNEIGVYYLRDEISQPTRNEDEQYDITRYAEKLSGVQWFNDYEHIIFSSGKTVKIIELDPRDKRNCMDIVKSEISNPLAIYNANLEKLFFTDLENGTINLFSVEFPEKITILGFAR